MKITSKDVRIPFDVPKKFHKQYKSNYLNLTRHSGRLMLFAGDQKVEHLNSDFYGRGIHPDDADPEHFFRIASKARIGAFAAQFGLIARYARDYPDIQYIIKLNSKTNLVKTSQQDPISRQLITVDQVMEFRKRTGLKVMGVGYTLYLGSEYESEMLKEATRIIYDAHQNGLIVILWIYPRGKAVKNEKDPHLIAGAAGVAACLGADFVKVSYPKARTAKLALDEAVKAAGRTKVICAGGSSTNVRAFLKTLRDQIDAGAGGNATGRNVHQKGLIEAIRMCNAIYRITVENSSLADAMKEYKKVPL